MARKKQTTEPVEMNPSLFLNIHWYALTGLFVATGIFPVAAFFGVISLYKTIYILSWNYAFHNEYIIEEKGIFVRTSIRVDYTRIRTVKSETHLLMMIVGIGNVRMATSDVYVPEFVLTGIDNYKHVEHIFAEQSLTNRKGARRIDIDSFSVN